MRLNYLLYVQTKAEGVGFDGFDGFDGDELIYARV